MAAAWALNLAVAEWIIRRRRASRGGARVIVAGAMTT
jgi:hypothetical protein